MSVCAYVKMSICLRMDCYPVLSVTWLIDVQSKHCSFACMPLERRVNEALVARSACFFIIERERTQCVCARALMCFPH